MNPELIGHVLIVLTLVPSIIFVAMYFRQPWWETQTGRMIFALASSDAAIMLLSTVNLVIANKQDPGPLVQWIGIGIFVPFVLARWYQLGVYIQILGNKKDEGTKRSQ